jgi:type IV pilus assembly protein PilC
MTGVGEDTGTLEHTLEVLANYYNNEVTTATERALSIMEPTIIVILAVIVCFILLAVYLPIFSIYGGITG